MIIAPGGIVIANGPGVQRRRIAKVEPHNDPRWLAFVEEQPRATIYHHPAWLRALDHAYGHRPAHLLCEDESGGVFGVLPLVRSHGLITGRRLRSLPHTAVAGPLTRDAAAERALLRAAVRLADSGAGARLEITSVEPLGGLVDGLGLGEPDTTYVLDLPDDPARLRFGNSRNHARIKWAVGKAAKLGVIVRPAETEAELRAWYTLYIETMRRHAAPPRPYGLFRSLWRQMQPAGLMRLLLAEQQTDGRARLLAGSLFFLFGDTVSYAFNGRRHDALPLRPNDVLQWRAIHDASAGGYRRYDFGEVADDNTGLAEFKSKWGAAPRPIYRAVSLPASGTGQAASPSPASRPRQAARDLWQRIPTPLTPLLGSLIYRYL